MVRFARRLLFFFALLLLSVRAASPSEEPFAPPTLEELSGNATFIHIPDDPGPLYKSEVVREQQMVAEIPLNISELSRVFCIPPDDSHTCSCEILPNNYARQGMDFAQMRCTFEPPVEGLYRVNAESSRYGAHGNFTIIMAEGQIPQVAEEIRQSSVPSGLMLFAVSFLIIAVLSYAIYFVYKFAMRGRDAMNALYDARHKTEDDMKVLRYRFLKREIDANTYNEVFKQKEQELAVINERITQALRGQKKKGKEAETS